MYTKNTGGQARFGLLEAGTPSDVSNWRSDQERGCMHAPRRDVCGTDTAGDAGSTAGSARPEQGITPASSRRHFTQGTTRNQLSSKTTSAHQLQYPHSPLHTCKSPPTPRGSRRHGARVQWYRGHITGLPHPHASILHRGSSPADPTA